MLLHRILTVLVIAPLFFWVLLYANDACFNLFWLTLVALAAREWGNLLRWEPRRQWLFALLNTGIAALGLLLLEYGTGGATYNKFLFYFLCFSTILWLFIVPYALYQYSRKQQLNFSNRVLAVVGSIMLLAFIWSTISIQRMIGGGGLLGLFIIVWCSDIGAYFAGQFYGKHKLASNISPKKTIEGFVGGFLAAMVAALILAFCVKLPLGLHVFLPLSVLVVIYAVIGDLWESVLKRRINIKDSSNILPGHGGILDRIDSWLSAMVLWAAGFLYASIF
ncbi:MAG: CDP-archaeol synthase [Cardiobacteriaceae bacterium]|nr:CDP-archaeol synthase [Cardiobacteriaceae bacterium]